MPDTTSAAFPEPMSNNCLRDIHRKLSSIRDQLPLHPHSNGYKFLCGRSGASTSPGLDEAILAFKKKFMPDTPQDTRIDAVTWSKLADEAGCAFSEVWQYELDALRARRHHAAAGARDPSLPAPGESAQQYAQRIDDALRTRYDPVGPPPPFGRPWSAPYEPIEVRPADEDEVIAQAHPDQAAGSAARPSTWAFCKR